MTLGNPLPVFPALYRTDCAFGYPILFSDVSGALTLRQPSLYQANIRFSKFRLPRGLSTHLSVARDFINRIFNVPAKIKVLYVYALSVVAGMQNHVFGRIVIDGAVYGFPSKAVGAHSFLAPTKHPVTSGIKHPSPLYTFPIYANRLVVEGAGKATRIFSAVTGIKFRAARSANAWPVNPLFYRPSFSHKTALTKRPLHVN